MNQEIKLKRSGSDLPALYINIKVHHSCLIFSAGSIEEGFKLEHI